MSSLDHRQINRPEIEKKEEEDVEVRLKRLEASFEGITCDFFDRTLSMWRNRGNSLANATLPPILSPAQLTAYFTVPVSKLIIHCYTYSIAIHSSTRCKVCSRFYYSAISCIKYIRQNGSKEKEIKSLLGFAAARISEYPSSPLFLSPGEVLKLH